MLLRLDLWVDLDVTHAGWTKSGWYPVTRPPKRFIHDMQTREFKAMEEAGRMHSLYSRELLNAELTAEEYRTHPKHPGPCERCGASPDFAASPDENLAAGWEKHRCPACRGDDIPADPRRIEHEEPQ